MIYRRGEQIEMTLIQKLRLKPGAVAVINSPKNIISEFKPFNPAALIPSGANKCFDFVLLFAANSTELKPWWKRIIPALKEDAVFWIAYPKKSSRIPSDLGRSGEGWAEFAGSDWQPVSSISIDDTWTASRFNDAPNLRNERKDRSSKEIRDLDGSLVVDRVRRMVIPPKDLADALSKNPGARDFFETLSFTNRKEYAVWIVEAKRSGTRALRVAAALEKLASNRQNPTES